MGIVKPGRGILRLDLGIQFTFCAAPGTVASPGACSTEAPIHGTHSAAAPSHALRQTYSRYANLISGSEPVESCLHDCFAEHLNAEVVLATVRDVATATQWLRTTFLYVRVSAEWDTDSGIGLRAGRAWAGVVAALGGSSSRRRGCCTGQIPQPTVTVTTTTR